jgi:hypothetical protein
MAVQLVVLCEGVDKPQAIALRARGGAGGLMRTGPDGEEHDAKEDHDYRKPVRAPPTLEAGKPYLGGGYR